MTAVAAHGNIHIVPEELPKRHMPSPPEFRGGAGNIGVVEVFEEVEAENSAKSDCHIGVARKIVVNLNGEHHYAEPHSGGGGLQQIAGEIVLRELARDIRNKHFFGQTHKEARRTRVNVLKGFPAVVNLNGNVRISHYGTRNKLAVEGNIHKELHIAVLRLYVVPVNIYGVA